MLNTKSSYLSIVCFSLLAFLATIGQEHALAAGMTESKVADDKTTLGFAYLKPPSTHKWKFNGAGGTGKGATLVYTDAQYLPAAATTYFTDAYARITEEDIPGVVSVKDYFSLYTRTPRHPSQPNAELAKLLEYIKKDNPGFIKDGGSITADTLNNIIILQKLYKFGTTHLHRKELWYLTSPSPYKTKTPVFVMLSYYMDTTSSSTTAINKLASDDMNSSSGLYQSYLRKYPNYLNY